MGSRKAFYVLRTFDRPGDHTCGTLEHEGGTMVCYWHANKTLLPPPGKYQLMMHDAHFALREHTAELRPVGHGSGIELGRVLCKDRVMRHGDAIIAYLKGMHRARDMQGVGTWLEVR